MKTVPIRVVRIYLVEGSESINKITNYLQTEAKVRGMSVFRAIKGFGVTGTHSASILDLSSALPVVIEFFDEAKKIDETLEHIAPMVSSEHIIFFNAEANS